MKFIYTLTVMVGLSVGVVGQSERPQCSPVTVSHSAAERAFDLLSSGRRLTPSIMGTLLRDGGQPQIVVELCKGVDTNQVRGALAYALGRPSSEVRFCTAAELAGHALDDIGRWVILPAGEHCRRPPQAVKSTGVRYAHAQVQQKPAAILPTTEIKVPERENAMLRDVQAQIDRLRSAYKLDEYEKELKSLAEIYENGKKTIDAKYKVAEFQKEAAPLAEQGQTIVKFAILNAKLTEEQKATHDLIKGDDGNWSWKPKAKPAQ